MTGASHWRWRTRPSATLPALAWVATIDGRDVTVDCGTSVAVGANGFFEGTWAGDADLEAIAHATTVFGSGIVALDDELLVISPSHPLEGVFFSRDLESLCVSNSLVALLVRTGLEPDPNVPYPTIFGPVADLKWVADTRDPWRLAGIRMTVPMANGSVEVVFYENAKITADGRLDLSPKPRERPFASFEEYRRRLTDAAASVIRNAPGYTPIVSLSAGYDSTAVAAVVAAAAGRRAVGFERSRTMRGGRVVEDSGSATAARLGMDFELFDAGAYMTRGDLAEAEFLAGGMSGEDLFMSALGPALARAMLMTGHWGGRTWDVSVGEQVKSPHPADMSGCSLGEFRLRSDFIHVPLPFFGVAQSSPGRSFVWDPDMRPYHVGGGYDRPIARRLAEEAGIPRGSFARTKAAVGVLLHRDGRPSFAPATVEAIDAFAASERRNFVFARRPPLGRRHRALIRLCHSVGAGRAVRQVERKRQALMHFEPVAGALVFRWAVSVIRARYSELAPRDRQRVARGTDTHRTTSA